MLNRRAIGPLLFSSLLLMPFAGCDCGTEPPPGGNAAKITNFNVDPLTVMSGLPVTVTWTVENATAVTITANPGGTLVDRSDKLTGTQVSAPITADTVFVITAFGDGGNATAMRNVTLTGGGDEVAILEFSATPMTVAPGDTAELAYRVEHATMVQIDEVNGGNILAANANQMGNATVTPTAPMTSYLLTAQGIGGPKTQTVTVLVEATPVIVEFTATPAMIELGESSTLAWEVTGATSIVIRDQDNVEIANSTMGTGSTTVMPTVNTTYTLYARNDAGTEFPSTPVMVGVNRAAKIISFTASPTTIDYGDSSTLQWVVDRSTSIDISAGATILTSSTALMGSFVVSPTANTDYTLVAHNVDGDATLTITVTVNPIAPRVTRFDATPNPALIGGSSTLTWDTIGALDVQIVDAQNNVVVASQSGSGTVDVTVTGTVATYTLNASNPNGTTQATTILIGQNIPEITVFQVTPLTFSGPSVDATVIWDSTGTTTRLELNGMPDPAFPGTPAGMYTFNISGRTDVTLYSDNAVGSVRRTFTIDQLAIETEPNDTPQTALPLPGNGGGAAGEINPAGDVDYYSVVVPETGNIFIEIGDGQGGCTIDSLVTLYGTDGTTVLGTDNDDGVDLCSQIDPRRDAFAGNLAAGTYYIAVAGGDPTVTGSYAILVTVSGPGCGNGILERAAMEECDDGGLMTGDGCDATCAIEPNGTISGPGQTQELASELGVGEVHWYEVTMLAEGYIRAEIFLPAPRRCDNADGGTSTDTVLELYDASFTLLGSDDDDGVGACSRIDPSFDAFAHVVAGTYWIRVIEDGLDAATGPYTLDLQTIGVGCPNGIIEGTETCDDNNSTNGDGCNALCVFEGTFETEPNETSASATLLPTLPAGGQILASGAITPNGDVDFYSITVPAGAHLDAYVTVNSQSACPADPMGQVQLLNTNGTTVIGTNSNGLAPSYNCGRVWPYTVAGSRAMAAGTYFIRVNEVGDNAQISRYFLHVNVILPGCGNTIIEGTESCDDGNAASGDGCSAACTFEPLVTLNLPQAAQSTVSASVVPSYERNAIHLIVASETLLYAETFEPTVASGTCIADHRLRLFQDNGTTEILNDDDDGIGTCARIHPQTDTLARLAPGSYWLVSEEDGFDREIDSYEILVRATTPDTCGNLLREAAIGETCDDGNTVSGDGCDAACQIEADAVIAGPPAEMTYNIDITPVGDQDFIRLDLSAPTIILAETGIPTIGSLCLDPNDTLIRLFNSSLTELTVNDDINGAANRCSRINGLTTAAARVDAGTYFVRIEDFNNDNVLSPVQVLVRLTPQNACGNGLQEAANNESCDDGNTVSGDGCSAACAIEANFTYNAVVGSPTTVTSSLDTATELEYVQINVTNTVYLSMETFAPTAPTCATADTVLTLISSAGVTLGSDDQDGVNSCSLIIRGPGTGGVGGNDTFARLTAGTYFLRIEEFGRNAIIGPYQIVLTPSAADVCGDGITEFAALEQCDDGNALGGDGCSPTCQFEIAATFSLPGAQVVHADAISLATQIDAYQLNVTAPMFMRVETYGPAAPDCTASDTFVRLLNSAGTVLGTDNDDGRSTCSLFNPNITNTTGAASPDLAFTRLDPGTYYLSVEENGRNAVITAYELRITSYAANVCGNGLFEPSNAEQCDDGNAVSGDGCSSTCTVDVTTAETEPNNTFGTANVIPLNGFGVTTMSAQITPAADFDFFTFTVPPGPMMVLRARTYLTAGNPFSTCNDATDTLLQLRAADGTTILESNDDINGSSNRCSIIDGTIPDTDPNARLLPGTYYIRASFYTDTSPLPTGPFFLQVQLQPL